MLILWDDVSYALLWMVVTTASDWTLFCTCRNVGPRRKVVLSGAAIFKFHTCFNHRIHVFVKDALTAAPARKQVYTDASERPDGAICTSYVWGFILFARFSSRPGWYQSPGFPVRERLWEENEERYCGEALICSCKRIWAPKLHRRATLLAH